MPVLTPEQMRALTDLLSAREQQLRSEVLVARQAVEERDAAVLTREAVDRGEEASVQIQSGIDHAELERDMHELLDIDEARKRLAEGTYGRCAACGEDIDFLRLQAQPAALRCAACQTLFERGHGGSTR